MKGILRKKPYFFGLMLISCFLFPLFYLSPAHAWNVGTAEYNNCLSTSGGRENITSVQWACEHAWSDSSYACCLWLGSSDSSSSFVYVDQGQSYATVYYYGMCTGNHSTSAINVYTTDDNGSISAVDSVWRGSWGSPGSQATTINIGKFIDGISPYTVGNRKYYSRSVYINRCNGENTSSCSGQYSDITLVLTESKKTLRMKAIDTAGNSLSSYMPDQTIEVDSGGYASLTAFNLTSYGYQKVKWGWSTWSGQWWDDTGLTYAAYLNDDTTIYAVYQLDQKTLTMKAIDTDGNSLSHLVADKTSTVINGNWVSITADSIPGYSKVYWGSEKQSNSWWSSTDMTYGKNLYNDETIFAVYERHEFAGQARVFEGNSISSSNYKSTGYVEADNTQILNINCLNAGCSATFALDLKTVRGFAAISYTVYRSQNEGNSVMQSTYPLYYPSMSGEPIKIYRNGIYESTFTEKIYPGQSVCYYVVFYPLGSHSNTTTATAKACAYANPSAFEGLTRVLTLSGSKQLGWQNTSIAGTQNIYGCTLSGCSVIFEHHLRRTSGVGSTPYTITRISNYSSRIESGTLKNEIEFFNGVTNSDGILENKETLTLIPGQVVCEVLSFKPNNNVINAADNVEIKACASALGDAQPPDPTDPKVMEDSQYSDAFIDIRVKSPDGPNKYQKYQKNVYAKPGQTLDYRTTYNPLLQYTHNIISQKIAINGTGLSYPDGVNTEKTLGSLFNTYKGSEYNNWNNSFTVMSDTASFASPYSENYYFLSGQTTKQVATNTHTVTVSEVGHNLSETATTNLNSSTQTTPGQVSFIADSNNNNVGVVYTASRSSQANAFVPYNYNTMLTLEEEPDSERENIIYSGEEKEIRYEIDVIPKANAETTDGSDVDKYATIMRDAITKVIIYRGVEIESSDSWGSNKTDELCNYFGVAHHESSCVYANERTETLNPSGKLSGDQHRLRLKIQVPDVPAGSQLCMAVASYPSSSGDDTNWSDPEGSHSWRISKSRCFTVAKKPTIQVWGGGVYSGGIIKTSTAAKNNLRGIGDLGGVIVFSSFAEQMVMARGLVTGFASGAATGLSNNIAGGGSYEGHSENYCNNRVPLSFANYSKNISSIICPNSQATGNFGMPMTITDKQSLIQPVPNENAEVFTFDTSTTISLSGSTKNTVRYNSDKDITIATSTAESGKTYIINTTQDAFINGNIRYQDKIYSSLSDVPKVIIYGKNVTIDCSVTKVDAIIIAEEKLSTCESNNINDKENSTPITINGAIITDRLLLNRTYGAATGVNSKIPSEIVNYDTSSLLWGRARINPDNKQKPLTSVYLREVAPRY